MNKFKKYSWWVLIIVPLVFAFGVYVNNGYRVNRPICPDDFKDSDKEIASFSKWLNEFYNKNPNASMKEMSEARRDFYVENNCTEALKRHNDFLAGNIDKETQQLIDMIGKEEISKAQRTPVCPNEYKTQEEYLNATGEWLSDFYDKNPKTTKEEMFSARMNFLIENGCEDLSKVN